ncbi:MULTISPECIES: DUF6541 family protein [Arthrobacter]|uniref:DUF6541 family protein n=2 Tax=Arthrobacter TaxID=1663 RepID=A0ABU9KJM3_9MICC|nr:DUF6541 family protein [Arthrobacter sp. YJM1]MDP5227237.1 hypothetical protein [Arthrobacter sp. YJM1]
MSWWETLPTLALSLAVYAIPGLALLIAAGVRGLNLAALAAPVTATVVACAGVVFGYAHIPFNPVSIAALTVILTLLVLAIRWFLKWRGAPVTRLVPQHNGALQSMNLGRALTRLILPLAVLVPAAIIGYRYMTGFGHADSFSETFDNIYHLNAVRFIADTQSANTATIGNLTEASRGMYPVGMHAVMALVFMLGAPSITVAVNWVTILLGAVIWPLSCIFLVSRIIGMRPLGLLATGVLSAAFSGFPYLMVGWGVLYPNHAALALLPACLGLLIEGTGATQTELKLQWPALILFAVTAPGLALAHPSALVALMAFGAPIVVAVLFRSFFAWRRQEIVTRTLIGRLGLVVMYAVVGLVVWVKARPAAAGWTGFQTNARAIGEVLTSAPMGSTIAWVIAILTLFGLYVISRNFTRLWWVAAMYAIGGLLYVIVSSWPAGAFRDFMTGVWYNDSFRLAALLPIVTLPVVALGADWMLGRLHGWLVYAKRESSSGNAGLPVTRSRQKLTRMAGSMPARVAAVIPVLATLVVGLLGQGGSLNAVQDRISTAFAITNDNSLVSTDELTLIKQLPGLVPLGEVLVGNPRTGASLTYAFTGIHVLEPHIFGVRSPDEQYLIDHWDEAAYNPKVCSLIKKENAHYALDFGAREITPRPEPLEGTRDLTSGSAPGMELIKSVGSARLFKVTACG